MLLHRTGNAVVPSVHAVLFASVAALVVTAFDAHAAPVARTPAAAGEQLSAADSTEFGSRKRSRARRGNAAGLAMMGVVAGTIGAVIAAERRRDAYRRAQYYYNPYYHDPYVYRQPYAYGAPRVYRHPRVYHRPYVGGPSPGAAAIHERRQYIDPQNPNSAVPTGVPRIGW